jgi:hypothetical protein
MKVKASYVPPTSFIIKDIGAVGRGKKVIGKMKKGLLKKYGYAAHKSPAARHAALRKAYKAYGGVSLFKKLQAQVVLRKRTQPAVRAVIESDRNWVVLNLMSDAERLFMTGKPRKAWMKMSPRARAIAMPDGFI